MGRAARIVIGLVAALAASAVTIAVVQTTRLADARDRIDELEERVERLERDLEGAGSDPGDDLFGGLLGGDTADLVSCLTADSPDGGDLFGGGGSTAATGRAQVQEIARAVESARGLRFETRVRPMFTTRQEVARRGAELLFESYPARLARAEARLLAALGAIPPDTDLRHAVRDLLETQVAGFYVPETGELVVPGDPSEPLNATERIVLAHELEHALAHQNLDLPVPEVAQPATADADLAALALVEGDATLTMQRYAVAEISLFESLGMLSDPLVAGGLAALEDVPHYLAQQLQFPYLGGLEFVCDRYAAGKWKAVDRAYRDPPQASDQILFPERYGESSQEPRSPRNPGAPWRQRLRGEFGAAPLLWLFEAPGGDTATALDDPKTRVAPWGGGEVVVWTDGPRTAVGMALVERAGERGLCESVDTWYAAAFGDRTDVTSPGDHAAFDGAAQDAVLLCAEDEVRLGIAPDLATARRIAR